MQPSFHDTIAAIATPPGLGGIAILRISGPAVRTVLHALFVSASLSSSGEAFTFRPRYMHYGHARDRDGHIVDDVLAVYMPGPHSATGEDVGEIHCHGGQGISAALLEAAMASGARLAGPGEFTRRALYHGRLDLTQAEAVAELIHAPTREGARLAAAKLSGGLAREINALREALDALRIQLSLAVDFPEEEEELLSREQFALTVDQGRGRVASLLASFERARLWREGALAVLAGRVNVGKSSLLNTLLGRPRAIVSDEPGTTRDYIEETVNLGGMPLRVMDTAGLRTGSGPVEAEGMRRARELTAEADMVLLVLDARQSLTAEEKDFCREQAPRFETGRIALVFNKMDLLEGEGQRFAPFDGLPEDLALLLGSCPRFCLSARTGLGMQALAEGLRRLLQGEPLSPAGDGGRKAEAAPLSAERMLADAAGDLAPNLRQAEALRAASRELEALAEACALGHPPDILSVHLEAVSHCLEEAVGRTGDEELLDRIFSSFCIGK